MNIGDEKVGFEQRTIRRGFWVTVAVMAACAYQWGWAGLFWFFASIGGLLSLLTAIIIAAYLMERRAGSPS